MFAIGFLSLLSVGFVAMSMGGDDDMSDIEQVEDIQNETPEDESTDLLDSIPAVTQEVPEEAESLGEPVEPEDMTPEMVMNNISALFQDSGLEAEFPNEFIDFIDGLEGASQEEAITGLAQFLEAEFGDIDVPDEVVTLVDDLQETEPDAVLGKIADFVQERGDAYELTDDVAGFLGELQGVLPDELITSIVDLADALIVALEQNDPTAGSSDTQTDRADPAEETDTTDTTESQTARPPMGDEYRDPLKIAEALDAQRIEDEIAAEEARQPVNLVTLSDASGTEIADELVLAERAEGADDTDPVYTVTAPDGENQITVGYDAEHTFQINYNADTTSVTAGLNSSIEGPEGTVQKEVQNVTDAEGNTTEETIWTITYQSSAEISLDVSAQQIGTHIAQIDLENPQDSLTLRFDDSVSGNFHLVFEESDTGTEQDGTSTKRAFIIQTPSTQTSLSNQELAEIIEQGRNSTAAMVAEIYLGRDSVYFNEQDGVSETLITNFINDNPQISANIEWASVVDYEEPDVQGGTGGSTGSLPGGMVTGSEEDLQAALDIGNDPFNLSNLGF